MSDQKFKVKIKAEAGVSLPAETVSRVLTTDGSGNVASSAVSTTTLAFLDATSSVQTQINSKINSSLIGANNGVASLDGGGKVPVSQLPNSVMTYEGVWNASTNTPTLADGTGNTGQVYRVSVAGTQNLGSGSIVFDVGDYAIYNASGVWEKSDTTDAVASVNGQTGVVTLTTTNISEGTNLYYTDERAQDSVGNILTDSSSVDFTYNDGANTITAAVLPAGVDHNQLLNYSANQHVDHTAVSISTPANGGLAGGGTIAANRSLTLDITNAIAETVADNADLVAIYDNSATALRKMTRANFLSGIPTSSTGDIFETSFSAANNQAAATNVTGLAFANGVVRSFKALVSVTIVATANLYEVFELVAIQKGSSWDMAISSTGDDSGIVFSITTAGQVQYTSTNVTGFTSDTMKFRAISTGI